MLASSFAFCAYAFNCAFNCTFFAFCGSFFFNKLNLFKNDAVRSIIVKDFIRNAEVLCDNACLLLLELLRETASPSGIKLQASNAIHSENEIIRKAQQYISAHIREKLSVPLVARQVDVSPSYLTSLFHKNLQISPGE